jgi:hypothetical protein
MKIILGLIVLGFAVFPSRVSSQDQENMTDGNYLLGSCQITIRKMDKTIGEENLYDAWRNGLCSGLVRGVLTSAPTICSPSVPLAQAVRVVDKYLRNHFEKLNLDDTVLIRDALSQAFPCSH